MISWFKNLTTGNKIAFSGALCSAFAALPFLFEPNDKEIKSNMNTVVNVEVTSKEGQRSENVSGEIKVMEEQEPDRCKNKIFTVANKKSKVLIKGNYDETFTLMISWNDTDQYGVGKGMDSEELDIMPGRVIERDAKGRNSIQVWAWSNKNGEEIAACSKQL